jgi:hypothetical protein
MRDSAVHNPEPFYNNVKYDPEAAESLIKSV